MPDIQIDPRLLNTIFAEVGGGSPEEVIAVASVFLNRAQEQGLEKALAGSSAYRLKSPQYTKASSGALNPYESTIYRRNANIIYQLMSNPKNRLPYTHFENIKAFGEPSWAKSATQFKDIGRQRFYTLPKPRVRAMVRRGK